MEPAVWSWRQNIGSDVKDLETEIKASKEYIQALRNKSKSLLETLDMLSRGDIYRLS